MAIIAQKRLARRLVKRAKANQLVSKAPIGTTMESKAF